jgi:predicted nucleic acid-binding protein
VILLDTSAWIEFLRATGSPVHLAARAALTAGDAAATEAVWMEVLMGGRSPHHTRSLQGLLARSSLLPADGRDFTEAAFLYRLCRANGVTVRSSVDCLIAAVAIRTDTPLLASDHDFVGLARHTPLELVTA